MTMHPWFKFAVICTIVMGIVLFCVIFGGYSSIYRSQNRIQASQSLVTDACKTRLDLLPKLTRLLEETDHSDFGKSITETADKANQGLQQLLSQAQPVDRRIINGFVSSQEELSHQLAALFSLIQTSDIPDYGKKIIPLKKEFSAIQDALFVAKKRYNKEVNYFNSRTKVFPGFLIAKLFGLNQLKYTPISKEVFLSGEKTFVPVTS